MVTVDRRTMLATGALALAGAAAQTGRAEAQAGPKPIFPVPVTTVPIVGETDVFAVRRIYCIGRNYAAHAIERGSDPTREPPFFFPEADRRHPERRDRRGRGPSLSVADQELSP
jgi:fumarylpyruvate hydrolase